MKKQTFTSLIIYLATIAGLTGCIEDSKIPDEVVGAGTPVFSKGATHVDHTASTIEVSAEIEKENGAQIIRRGFCYGTNPNPTVDNAHVETTTTGTGAYAIKITELSNNTSYHIRSYAVNSQGTSYGEPELVVSTETGLGVVQTVKPSAIHAITAQTGGEIASRGEGEVIRYGVYYWEASKGVTAKDSIVSQDDADRYVCHLSGLQLSTKYYVQAFLTNTYGTIAGDTDSLTTRDGLPSVNNVSVKPGFTDATLTSSVTNGGDETVTIVERGFCWSIESVNPLPAIDDDAIQSGSGTGYFEDTVINLVAQQKYVARAYAKSNFGGIQYSGNAVLFSTKTDVPTVQTENPATPTNGSITVGGIISDEGFSSVDSAGVCWSVSETKPSLTDKTVRMSVTAGGHFAGTLSMLKGGVTYHIRAYASNSKGTAYGDVKTFTPPPVFNSESKTFPSVRLANSTAYFAIGGLLYLLGGDTGPNYSNELWVYTPANGWEQRKPFTGGAAKWQTAIPYGGGAFIHGGIDNNEKVKGDFYYYNVSNNEWQEWIGKDTFYLSAGYAHSNSIFYVGGKNDTVRNDVWRFDVMNKDLDTWQKKTDFPEKQYGGITAVINNVAYVGLGKDTLDACNGKLWTTSDGADTWTLKTTCSIYSGGILGGVACNGNIYVVDDAYYILEYNPVTDRWTKKSQLPASSRNLHCIYEQGGKIYIGLGQTNTLVVYDPVWDN